MVSNLFCFQPNYIRSCTPRPAPPVPVSAAEPAFPSSLLSLSFSPPPPSLRAKLHRLELIGHLPFSLSSPLIHFSSSNLRFSHANIFQSSLNTVRILYTRRIALFEAKNSLYRKSEERILGKISLHSQMFVLGGGTLTRYSPTPSRRESLRYLGRSLDDLETLEGSPTTRRERFRVDPRRGKQPAGGVQRSRSFHLAVNYSPLVIQCRIIASSRQVRLLPASSTPRACELALTPRRLVQRASNARARERLEQGR